MERLKQRASSIWNGELLFAAQVMNIQYMERRVPSRRTSYVYYTCAANGSSPFHIRGALRSIYVVSSVPYTWCPLPYTGCCHYLTTLTRPSLRGAAGRASLDAYPSDRAPMPIYCSSTPRVFMSCLPSSVWNIWYSRLIQHVARPTA